jgi:hypothetical protein
MEDFMFSTLRVSLFALLALGLSACTTLPKDITKQDGAVVFEPTKVVAPDSLNGHDRKDETIEVKGENLRVGYTHGGYGGFGLVPYVGIRAEPVGSNYDGKEDLTSLMKRQKSKVNLLTSYPFTVGGKKVTVWMTRGISVRPASQKYDNKIENVDYILVAKAKDLVLEGNGVCSPGEEEYFDSDIKQTFEAFLKANQALF